MCRVDTTQVLSYSIFKLDSLNTLDINNTPRFAALLSLREYVELHNDLLEGRIESKEDYDSKRERLLLIYNKYKNSYGDILVR